MTPRKPPVKRAFAGMAGSPLAKTTLIEEPRSSYEPTLAERLERQRRREELDQVQADFYRHLENEGWEPGDDQPVLVSSRARNRNSGPVKFQRYQFRLRTTGDRSARFDGGANPAIYDSMAASKQLRDSGMDTEGASTSQLHSDANKNEGKIASDPVSIANVAQSMPKGFSTGVLTDSLEYTDIPREPQPETAWVFNDPRFKFFVSRLVPDAAFNFRHTKDWEPMKLLSRAVKAYACLHLYFRVGRQDKTVLSDAELSRAGLWKSANALKRYRCRLMKDGLALFGTPADPRDIEEPYDPERVAGAWNLVLRVYRALVS